MKDVLDAIPDFRGAPRRGGEDGGGKPRKTRSTPSELNDELVEELKSVPDPEGLLLLLEKAAKIGECKDRGREAFKSGEHKERCPRTRSAPYVQRHARAGRLVPLEHVRVRAGAGAVRGRAVVRGNGGRRRAQVRQGAKPPGDHLRRARHVRRRRRRVRRRDAGLPLEANEASQSRAGLAAATRKAKQSHPMDWIKLPERLPERVRGGDEEGVQATRAGAPPGQGKQARRERGRRQGARGDFIKLFKHVGEANRVLTDATERMRWENARSKAERAARQAQAAYANASDQARAAGFGRFDPYDRKRGAGSSYCDDFEEGGFFVRQYAYSEMYDDGYGW